MENIKNDWNALSETVLRQQKINESLVREIMLSRADRSHSKLLGYGWFGLIAAVFAIPAVILLGEHKGVPVGIIYLSVAGLVAGILIQLAALRALTRADMESADIASYERAVISYRRLVLASYMVLVPYFAVVILCLAVVYYNVFAAADRLYVLIGALPLTLLLCWAEYRFIYRDRIRSLRKSAADLREFDS